MPKWHSSFRAMRGLVGQRSWMTWEEFQLRVQQIIGRPWSRYHSRQALASQPPDKQGKIQRFTDQHVVMAAGYANGKGWCE